MHLVSLQEPQRAIFRATLSVVCGWVPVGKLLLLHHQTKKEIERNHLESFSPKNTHEIIYKKMKKIHNKKSAIIHSFLKNAASSSKIKGLILSKKNNNSSNNYKGIINSKEIFNRTSKDKNF